MKKEEPIHNHICNYISMQYPDTIFTSDASGVKLTIGAAKAMKMKRSNHAIPDLLIFKPNGIYHGLILEIKTADTKLKTKKGTWATPHIAEQADTLEKLNKLGYCATFVCGFDEAKKCIDSYFAPIKFNIGVSFGEYKEKHIDVPMTC